MKGVYSWYDTFCFLEQKCSYVRNSFIVWNVILCHFYESYLYFWSTIPSNKTFISHVMREMKKISCPFERVSMNSPGCRFSVEHQFVTIFFFFDWKTEASRLFEASHIWQLNHWVQCIHLFQRFCGGQRSIFRIIELCIFLKTKFYVRFRPVK